MKKKPSALMRRLKYFSPIDRYNDNHTQETYEDREWEMCTESVGSTIK